MEMKSIENGTALKETTLDGETGKEVLFVKKEIMVSEETGNYIECIILFDKILDKLERTFAIQYDEGDSELERKDLNENSKYFKAYLKDLFLDSVLANMSCGDNRILTI
jgi:hypothetical protein